MAQTVKALSWKSVCVQLGWAIFVQSHYTEFEQIVVVADHHGCVKSHYTEFEQIMVVADHHGCVSTFILSRRPMMSSHGQTESR